ncbi:MAG: tetratricopeptide repeat protein, partial [Planctomycetota bacterium]
IRMVLAVFAMALYSDTLRAGFVSDDKGLIVNNEIIHSVGNVPRYFVRAFSTRGMDKRSTAYYRPVVAASFALDYALGEGQPWMFHLHNVVAFGICVVLVYLLLRRLLPSKIPAVVGAFVFAAHPIHTETVCWIAGRTDLFALLFFLAAFLCALQARRNKGGWGWFGGAAVGAALAMFSKEVALILLPVWVVYELTIGRVEEKRGNLRRSAYTGAIFTVCTVAYLVARWQAVGALGTSAGSPVFDPWTINGMATIGRCVLEYVGKLVLPLDLSFAFEIAPFTGSVGSYAILSLAGGLGLLVLTLYASWKYPRLAFWLWWMWLGLGPALNIIPINEVVAERFLFLPSVGYCSLLGVAFGALIRAEGQNARLYRHVMVGACVLIVVSLSAQTVARSVEWRDERRLYLSTLRSAPYSPWARTLAGEVYLSDPRVPERAYLHYRRALELSHEQPALRYVIHNALGQLTREMQRPAEAMAHYRQALELQPDSAVVRTNQALLWIQEGEKDESEELLEKGRAGLEQAIEIDPAYADAYFVLGYWEMEHGGDLEEAIDLFDRAVEKDKSFAAALEYKAHALLRMGRVRQALRAARRALTIQHSESVVSLIERIQNRLGGAGGHGLSDDDK